VPRVQNVIKKPDETNPSVPNEYTVKRPDGSRCPVLIYGSPIIRDGKVVGRRGIIIDISERKKQELKLLKAKEELERINNTLEQSVAERTKQLTEANTQLLKVQKENLQSQFEVLKQQVNPHFLFNSLNVLTSLIKIDPDLAESFTERLSKVYRYVLENKEKDLVSLSTELEFLNAYLFLLEIGL
jgi:LytS/YehU family sensor histidine kinase